MCIQCEIENTLIDLHARDLVSATLDGETLTTGQIESLLDYSDFDDILWTVTERGKLAVEAGVL